MDSSQDHVVLWSGKPGSSPNNAMFLFSIRGFLEWGPGGNGTAADQDVALFRPIGSGGAGQLWIQSFHNDNSTDAFRVNKATSGADGEKVFAVDTVNNAIRVAAGASGFADSDFFTAVGRKKTTNDTATALATIALGDDRVYYIVARVVARRADGNQRAFFYRAACFYRQGGGNATAVGVVNNLVTEPTTTSFVCTIEAVSGSSNVEVRVTGAPTTDVYWVGTIEYQSVKTDA